jgi:Fe-S-cluster containining protein
MPDATRALAPKELLWLGCREKTCCHNTKVILTGRDVWRIAQALELQPWDFTLYCDAEESAVDGFQLAPGGPFYQVMLAKRGAVGPNGAPCIFLWRLADGHAQCGLGGMRPLPCQAYPAVLVEGMLACQDGACTCRRWSVVDLDGAQETARLRQLLAETAEYRAIVAAWNAQVAAQAGDRTYREFCAYLLDAYAAREGGAA